MKKVIFGCMCLALVGCNKPIHGGFTDFAKYDLTTERPDLKGHMIMSGALGYVGGDVLEKLNVPYPGEVAAVGGFTLITLKEYLRDSWVDRGDIGANAVGAFLGYFSREFLHYEW